MAFDCRQFKKIINEVLDGLGLNSPSAVNLLLGTAAQESAFGTYLEQMDGPALGVFQMEPETERDIWLNYLQYRHSLAEKIYDITSVTRPGGHLKFNLAYQIAMARIHYLRVQKPLPEADDITGLAHYWKDFYNTDQGQGSVQDFLENYLKYVVVMD